jgi:hypothetical protein
MLDSTRRGFLRALGLTAAVSSVPAGVAIAGDVFHVEHSPEEFSEEEIAILRQIVNQLEAERITGRELVGYRVYSRSNRRPAGVTMEFATRPKEKA